MLEDNTAEKGDLLSQLIISESGELSSDSELNNIVNAIQGFRGRTNKTCSELILRRVAQIIVIFLSLPSGTPFIRPARNFTASEIYGYSLASGTTITYANVYIWASLAMVDDIIETSESVILTVDGSKFGFVFKRLAAFLLATLAATPQLYIAYHYNDDDLFYLLLCLFPSITFRAYGFRRLIDNIAVSKLYEEIFYQLCTCKKIQVEISTEQLRSIRAHIGLSLRAVTSSQARLLAMPMSVFNSNSEIPLNVAIRQLIVEATNFFNNREDHFCGLHRYGRARSIVRFSGSFIPTVQIGSNLVLTYLAIQLFIENPIVSLLFMILAVIPGASLLILSGRNTASNVYEFMRGIMRGDDTGLNAFRLNQKLALGLYGFSLIVALLSYGASGFAVIDNLPAKLVEAFLPWFILAEIFFHVYVLTTNSNALIKKLVQTFSTDEEKIAILKKADFITKLLELIEKMPIKKLDKFIAWLEFDKEFLSFISTHILHRDTPLLPSQELELLEEFSDNEERHALDKSTLPLKHA